MRLDKMCVHIYIQYFIFILYGILQYHQTIHNYQMIKAPFRFDVEYFSLIVLFRNIYYQTKHHFKDAKEKDIYISRLKRSSDAYVTNKMVRELQQNGYYCVTTEQPTVYIIVLNNQTNQIRACANNNDDISVRIKFYFKDTLQMYSYIRNNCNSHNIKMTNKGSMIIDYTEADDVVEQIRIQSEPVVLHLDNFEELWAEVKSAWNRRKQTKFQQNQELYELPIQQGTINIFNKQQSKSKDKDDKIPNPQKGKSAYLPKKAKQVEMVQFQSSSQVNYMTESTEKRKIDRYKKQDRPSQNSSRQSLIVQSRQIKNPNKYPVVDHPAQYLTTQHRNRQYSQVAHHEARRTHPFGQNGKRSVKHVKYSSEQQQKEQMPRLNASQLQLINEIAKSRSHILASLQSQAHKIRQSLDCQCQASNKMVQQLDFKLVDLKEDVGFIKSQLQRLTKRINEIATNMLPPSKQPEANRGSSRKIHLDNSISQQIIQNNAKTPNSQSQISAQIKNKDFNLQQHDKMSNQGLSNKLSKKQNLEQRKSKKQKKRKE